MKLIRTFLAIVTILVSLSSGNIYSQEPVKILSYNVLEGLRGDTIIMDKFVSWVSELDPDIIGFQEMNNFTQQKLENFAAKYGHRYAVLSKTDGYPVALTSKYPIVNVQKVIDNMHHVYLVANINTINVIVIHFSPFSYLKRQQEVNEIIARADLFPKDEKVLIMGDFNSLSEKDASSYGAEDLNLQKEREMKEAHIRNLNNGKFDYSVTGAIEKKGFTDLVYKFHKNFQSSIPTRSSGSKYEKRIDFIYVNPVLEKYSRSAEILKDDVTHEISDHYPVFATFEIK